MYGYLRNLSLSIKICAAAISITTIAVLSLAFISGRSSANALVELGTHELAQIADNAERMCAVQNDLLQAKLRSDLACAVALLAGVNAGKAPDGAILVDDKRMFDVGGNRVPSLTINGTNLTNDFAFVDEVRAKTGSTCTVFHVLHGSWLRIATNVTKADGSRAVGTTIDSDSPVYQSVMQGRTYFGHNVIQGRHFETAYQPLRNQRGEIAAVLYVGVPYDDFAGLQRSIGEIKIGAEGYVFCINSDRVFTLHPNLLGQSYSNEELLGPMFGNDSGVVIYSHEGREKIAAFRYFEPFDWYIVSSAYTEEFEAPAIAARNQAFMLAGLFVVVGGVLSFLVGRNMAGGINRIRHLVDEIANGDGDLTRRLPVESTDEVGQLAAGFNLFVDKVHAIIVQVATSASQVASASTEIAAASQEVSSGMGEQSQQLDHVTIAITQMSAAIQEVTNKCAQTVEQARESGGVAEEGGKVVAGTIVAMQSISGTVVQTSEAVTELGKRTETIGRIVDVINDIADQTNLLALNAAIEAARAGEHGRGFAVVADEVRKLADRTTTATEEISNSISEIQERTSQAVMRMKEGTSLVEQGVTQAQSAGSSLEQIVASAGVVTGMVETIASASAEQSSTADEMQHSVEIIAAGLREATQGSEQMSEAAGQLSMEAEELQQLVRQFKINASLV